MKNEPRNPQQILSRHISGFHQYRLGESPRPVYVSENLCELLSLPAEELLDEKEDRYVRCIHPADRQRYRDFLTRLSHAPQTATLQYRLLRQDGSSLHVSDTAVSYIQEDQMLGDSVLTDITELNQENRNLQFLSETMPCGFLKYTCENQPKITFLSDRMLQILRIPGGSGEQWEDPDMYKQNIFLLIPMEERRRFSLYLDRVYRQGAPIAGEMTVLRCDGTRGYLFGWVTKSVNAQGQEEFQSACIDITQQHHIRKERETRRYLKALAEVYDKIFEYDLAAHTVKCLCGQNSQMFRWIENVPMQMEDATDKWILGNVFEEDRERVRNFFRDFFRKKCTGEDQPPMLRYRALSSGGTLKTYMGLFVSLDSEVSLFCCRSVPDAEEADSLRSENTSLRDLNENMHRLVMKFTDGLATFEILGDTVTPLYASDNVCEFFGYTRQEWLTVMQRRTPIPEFIAGSSAAYEDFMELLARGEAEFTYRDLGTGTERRIKAICSRKHSDGNLPRYVMLYNLDAVRLPETSRVQIRTFGYFDVFVGNKPIAFRNEKSKELFALLVDRRGGFVSSEEAISFLWEDEPASPVTLARYRKVALRLKNILEEYGIGDIVESVNGKRRLVTDKVSCDLYDYLSGQEAHAQLFKGSYLSNYSWGENTLAQLLGDRLYAGE